MCIIDCLSTIVFILPVQWEYTKVIILILWWRNFQLEYWRTFQLVSTGYRKAFYNFDAELVAQMTDEDIERLMQFEGIVKNRLKIKSTITNAKLFLAVQKEFGSFYNYTLSFFPDKKPIINTFRSLSEIPVSSPESDAMSKDMKKRGFKFFGTTICYAHLQASGFINDHLTDCICRKVPQ